MHIKKISKIFAKEENINFSDVAERERERRRTTAVKRPSKKEKIAKIAKIETVHGHIECVSKSVSVHCVS